MIIVVVSERLLYEFSTMVAIRDARNPVRALLGVQALDIMGSRTPRGGGSIAGFRPEGGVRLQGFRIFGREAPETAPKAPF